jgi:hypothetical protein
VNWNRASGLLQIGANIGILLGLILVGVQIRDSNRIANAQFVADDYLVTMASYELIIGESMSRAWARASANSNEHTDEDIIVIDAFLNREWFKSRRERDIAATGIKPFEIEREITQWVFVYLGNETALRWWEGAGGILNTFPELKDGINRRLEGVSDLHHQSHKNRIERFRGN